jgi:hypothetical protein
MSVYRDIAIAAMKATDVLGGTDFLEAQGIKTPVPQIEGAIPAVAREPFFARDLKRTIDLVVIFSIGDFPSSLRCSNYFNPNSPWYNVFYGAYGIKSYKPDGSAWGFHPDGSANFDELIQVPFTDYNFLTAGELGCPPDKMCFEAGPPTLSKWGQWEMADCTATIPSGLHHLNDAVKPNLEYYAVFGRPEESFLVGGRQSYEPVQMHGKMFWRQVAPKITLVWGGMCQATPSGDALLNKIVDAMKPLYG